MSYYKQALAMRQALFPGNHANVATSLNSMDTTYWYAGQYEESTSYYKQALAMQQALFPGSDANIATSLNNMGIAFEKVGQYAKGLE